MNIRNSRPHQLILGRAVVCPHCRSTQCKLHGYYTRKGFHGRCVPREPVVVLRFRCLDRECLHCTFSVLPPMVLRYTRFFWPCFLMMQREMAAGETAYRQAHHWKVGWGVIRRIRRLKDVLEPWIDRLFREMFDGLLLGSTFERKVKRLIDKLGRLELVHRWYRHHYAARF